MKASAPRSWVIDSDPHAPRPEKGMGPRISDSPKALHRNEERLPPRTASAGDHASTVPEYETAGEESPAPPLKAYLALNALVWLALAIMGALMAFLLGTARLVILICALLALLFLAVSLFDYLWLRFLRR